MCLTKKKYELDKLLPGMSYNAVVCEFKVNQ